MGITKQSGPSASSSGDQEPLALALVSRNTIVRDGLADVLSGASGMIVKHRVDNVAALPAKDPPALIVLDLYGHHSGRIGQNFWALMPSISRTIVLCSPENPPNFAVAVRGGARALLTREVSASELLTAIQIVRQGGLHVCVELLGEFVTQVAPKPPGPPAQLTDRELEIMRWVAAGLAQPQISQKMGIAETTVATYVRRLRVKLNAESKAELMQRAIELGYGTSWPFRKSIR